MTDTGASFVAEVDPEDPTALEEVVDMADFLARHRDLVPSRARAAVDNSRRPPDDARGESISLFYHACTARGKSPFIKYAPAASQQFVATVLVDDEPLADSPARSSKRLAKNDACRLALPVLNARHPALPSASLPAAPSHGSAENWVGQLNQFIQKRQYPQPTYQPTWAHFSQGPFSCSVAVPPLIPSPLGADGGRYVTKADAKQAAAKNAVLWLRDQGYMDASEVVPDPDAEPGEPLV